MTRFVSASHTATTTSIRHGAWARRSIGVLLALGGCAAILAVLPATAQAQLSRGISTPRSASTFCQNKNLSVSKVSSIVGTTVSLSQAVLEKTTLECIYFGKVAATVSHPIDEVVISMQPSIPAAELATLAAAEARVAALAPKGVKLIFTSLSSVGKTAFSWTYSKALNGGQLVGIADNKGTTGFGAVVGGAAKTFGAAAGHVPVLERLLALDMAA
jgi:hypothetical protein